MEEASDELLDQVLEAFQEAAAALPVAQRVVHEVEGALAPEVLDREDGPEGFLEADVLALLGQQFHLEEAPVRLSLEL